MVQLSQWDYRDETRRETQPKPIFVLKLHYYAKKWQMLNVSFLIKVRLSENVEWDINQVHHITKIILFNFSICRQDFPTQMRPHSSSTTMFVMS